MVDSSAGMDVPVASRQRSQARPYKIVCPMCETVGYVPRNAAGKDIRCANRECLVPVFLAPRPEKKKDEEEAPAKKLTAKSIMMGLSAMALIGFAVWWFVTNVQSGPGKSPEPNNGTPVKPLTVTETETKPQTQTPVEKPLTVNAERDAALALMSRATDDQSHNRSKALCERLMANTAVECGDLKLAQTFVERLQHDKTGVSFYRIPPLTSIAWRQINEGNPAAAAKTLDETLHSAADLPTVGRFSIDSAAWLSAALVAAGRDQDARALADRFPVTGPTARLFAAEARARAWKTYDVDQADANRPLMDATSLQQPVIVEIAVAMGFPAEGLRLAQSVSDPALQSECEIAWIEAVERAKLSKTPSPKTEAPAPDTVLAKLKPHAQARCQARLGALRLRHQDQAGAETALKAALAALGSARPGAEFALPAIEEIYRLQPLDPGPARQAAVAWAEIARLQAALGQTKDANQSLATALDSARASAPSPAAVNARLKSANSDASSLHKELGAALKITNDSKATEAFNDYRRNLHTLEQAADARFALELDILDASLQWADPVAVWRLIRKRASESNLGRKEPYLTTALPWQLISRIKSNGDGESATVEAIEKALGETPPHPAALLDDAIVLSKVADHAATTKAIQAVPDAEGSTAGVERSERERAVLIIADRLVRAGKFEEAFIFARSFQDPLLKEEAVQWSAALASRLGQAHAVKSLLDKSNSSFLPTELVSGWSGFLIGLAARERTEPATASAAPPATAAPSSEDSKSAETSKS